MLNYQPSPKVVFTEISEGEAVLLHLGTKLYYSLNGTGTFLWKILEVKNTANENELIQNLTHHYQISLKQAQGDVEEFIEDLSHEDLIEKNS